MNIKETMKDIDRNKWQNLRISSCYQTYDCLFNSEKRYNHGKIFYITIENNAKDLLCFFPCYLLPLSKKNTTKTYNIRELVIGLEEESKIERFLSQQSVNDYNSSSARIKTKDYSYFFPNLLCSLRHGYSPVPIFHTTVDEETKLELSGKIVDNVLSLCKKLKCSSVCFLYVNKQNPIYKVLSERKLLKIFLDSDTWLNTNYDTFDNFLKSRSSSIRAMIKAEIKKFNKFLTIRKVKSQEIPIETIALLFANLQYKYSGLIADKELDIPYIEFLNQMPFVKNIFTALNSHNDIVGFSFFYELNKMLFARIVGFDYTKLGRDFCYFNTLFYYPIQYAIDQKIRMINYGIKSLETKIQRGCDIMPYYGFFHFFKVPDGTIFENIEIINNAKKQYLHYLKQRYIFEEIGEKALLDII